MRIRHCRGSLEEIFFREHLHVHHRILRQRVERVHVASVQAQLAHLRAHAHARVHFQQFRVSYEGHSRRSASILFHGAGLPSGHKALNLTCPWIPERRAYSLFSAPLGQTGHKNPVPRAHRVTTSRSAARKPASFVGLPAPLHPISARFLCPQPC